MISLVLQNTPVDLLLTRRATSPNERLVLALLSLDEFSQLERLSYDYRVGNEFTTAEKSDWRYNSHSSVSLDSHEHQEVRSEVPVVSVREFDTSLT